MQQEYAADPLKRAKSEIPITLDEIMNSRTPFEYVNIAGDFYYINKDPIDCQNFWVYFWNLKALEGYFNGALWDIKNFDIKLPIEINLRTKTITIDGNLAKQTPKKIFYFDIKMISILIGYIIFLVAYAIYQYYRMIFYENESNE